MVYQLFENDDRGGLQWKRSNQDDRGEREGGGSRVNGIKMKRGKREGPAAASLIPAG